MASKTGKVISHVPAYSQFLDVPLRSWKHRACGVVSLKMLLDYWKENDILVSQLIREGKKINISRLRAYIPGVGWSHRGLAALAKHHGFYGKNYDWAKNTSVVALAKLLPYLQKQPVIASIYKNFSSRGSGHLVVLTGHDTRKIFYNDPISKTRKRIKRSVLLSQFLRGWKRRIIVINLRKPKS